VTGFSAVFCRWGNKSFPFINAKKELLGELLSGKGKDTQKGVIG
jgi:hypothetical protein